MRIGELLDDLKYGFRLLRRTPGFSLAAILALALGIGANTAIFSVVHAVLLAPLPYSQPGRLVMVWEDATYQGFPRGEGFAFKGIQAMGKIPDLSRDYYLKLANSYGP